MKVEFFEEVEVSGEVDIDTGQIAQALQDALGKAKFASEESLLASDHEKAFTVQRFVTNAHQCLSAVSGEMIDSVNDINRNIIANALLDQVERWKVSP